MTPSEVATIVGVIATVTALILAGVIYLIKSQIAQSKVIGSNGSSVVDSLDLVKDSLNRLHSDLQDGLAQQRHDLERFDQANAAQHEAIRAQLAQHAASPAHDRRRSESTGA